MISGKIAKQSRTITAGSTMMRPGTAVKPFGPAFARSGLRASCRPIAVMAKSLGEREADRPGARLMSAPGPVAVIVYLAPIVAL